VAPDPPDRGADPAVGIPDPAVVLLVGASGAGKSTWAAARYLPTEVVSSDALRAVVGSGEADLDASDDAFRLLDAIVAARVGRGLCTVIDTLGLDESRRAQVLALARAGGLPAVAVLFDTPPALCRERNRRRDRPVPAAVLTAQLARLPALARRIADEGWDTVVRVAAPAEAPAGASARGPAVAPPPPRLGVRLQISRFPWGADPAGWLGRIADAAVSAGFEGIALMDHLIQIPQVGRAWEPIPDPWVALGLLAGRAPGLQLGTLVTPVTFRAAGVVAKTAATLDALTGGRAFVGVGAGWWEREHRGYGVAFPPARERLAALERSIETMRALWAPGTKAYDGERVVLPETTLYPRPESGIPIIVGGSGERRTLRIAAQLGDACNIPSAPAVVARKAAVLREHCARAGRDPAEVAVTVLDVPIVGADRADTARRVERLRGRTAAPAFARRHGAGPPADHIARYVTLAELGVRTVFASLPDLEGPDDVMRMQPVIAGLSDRLDT
jgi:alkanesulfonate monooxygenase SsuD/methylene tetrahydromethanopterin reductase-like flavin-dependent oxidoreductase (luciferase family)/predicted kinase